MRIPIMRTPIMSMRSAILSAWHVLRRMHEDCALYCRICRERLQTSEDSRSQHPRISSAVPMT